jgi:hypothetical protein
VADGVLTRTFVDLAARGEDSTTADSAPTSEATAAEACALTDDELAELPVTDGLSDEEVETAGPERQLSKSKTGTAAVCEAPVGATSRSLRPLARLDYGVLNGQTTRAKSSAAKKKKEKGLRARGTEERRCEEIKQHWHYCYPSGYHTFLGLEGKG